MANPEEPPDEEIPPPSNRPMVKVTLRTEMTPEEFRRMEAQFIIDTAKLMTALDEAGIQMPPDDIQVVAVIPVEKPEIE